MTYEVTNFETEVIEASYQKPIVVDFWAPWCGPCRTLSPALEKLAAESSDKWKLAMVNVDENQELAARYQVRGIPAVKLFTDGTVTAEFAGALPEIQIQRWLNEHIPSENDKKAKAALTALEKGEKARAKALFEQILHDESGHSAAAFHLAKLTLFEDPARAGALLKTAGKDPAFLDETSYLEKLAELVNMPGEGDQFPEDPVKPAFIEGLNALKAGNFEAALERLIEVVMKNKDYGNGIPKDACIGVFYYLGHNHETTRRFRRRFDMALY